MIKAVASACGWCDDFMFLSNIDITSVAEPSQTHTHTDTKTYSINHGVLWPYLLNANIMD